MKGTRIISTKPWKLRRSVKIRVDPAFKNMIDNLYPDAASSPERSRRVMDDIIKKKKR